MSIANRLQDYLQHGQQQLDNNLTRGQWFNIRLQPNLLSGEQLNVGVGFIDRTGRLHTRVTDNLARLRCLYDDRIDLDDMQLLVGMADSLLDQERYAPDMPHAISPQLTFSAPSYAAGNTVDDVLDTFFEQTVSLIAPLAEEEQGKRSYFRGYSNAAIRNDVRQWMGKHHGLLASRIFPRDPSFKIRTNDGGRSEEYSVDLPLRQPGQLAGSIVSAYCSGVQVAQLRLLQSAMSINTAKRHLEGEKIGLFILRPDRDSGLDHSVLNRFDDVIDESVWQLHDAGVHVGVETSVEALGKEIAGWAA